MLNTQDKAAEPTNAAVAAAYGALVALLVAYALSYVLTHFGLGVVSASGKPDFGPAVFARAGLNLYASQHITLVGEGRAAPTPGAGAPARTSGSIALPITVWAAMPILALLVGGYSAGKSRALSGRWGMIVPAAAGGVVYALVLAALSYVVQARIDDFVMPRFGGIDANPPDVLFHPSASSTILFAGGFGVVFSYLGALIAVRAHVIEGPHPGRFWPSVKAAVGMAIVVQLLMLIAAGAWFLTKGKPSNGRAQQTRIVEILPAATGIAYTMINGATVVGGVKSRLEFDKSTHRTFYGRANLYDGVRTEQLGRRTSTQLPSRVVWPVALVTGLAVLAAGALAVRSGARGGSVPVGLQIAAAHTAYVAALVVLCGQELMQKDPVSVSTIVIRPTFGIWLLFSFLAVAVLATVGAHLQGMRVPRTP